MTTGNDSKSNSGKTDQRAPAVAVLLPCYNEEAAIAGVIGAFRAALPDATIYVFDNASDDNTAGIAASAGAVVRHESRRGKGAVVRRMFSDIEADVYVLADGDGTYNAASAPAMVQRLIDNNLDMVVGSRKDAGQAAVYRPGHRFGNWLFSTAVATLFGRQFSDILSGYRIMSRRFVKSLPVFAEGFEIETELTIHSLDMRLPVDEVETPYHERPEGSESKLNSFRDGWRILLTIFWLVKEERPLPFFSAIAGIVSLLSVVLAIPLFVDFFATGLVERIPTAILVTGMMVLSFALFTSGLVLDSVSRARKEAKMLAYLTYPALTEQLKR